MAKATIASIFKLPTVDKVKYRIIFILVCRLFKSGMEDHAIRADEDFFFKLTVLEDAKVLNVMFVAKALLKRFLIFDCFRKLSWQINHELYKWPSLFF